MKILRLPALALNSLILPSSVRSPCAPGYSGGYGGGIFYRREYLVPGPSGIRDMPTPTPTRSQPDSLISNLIPIATSRRLPKT